jgi:integrase
MPRPAKPWYRESKCAWYATVQGKMTALGVRGRENEAEAVRAWHRLMGGLPLEPAQETPPMLRQASEKPQAVATVADVVSGFLADVAERAARNTVRNYRIYLSAFAKNFGTRPTETLTVAETEAYTRKPEWSASYRNDILAALVSAFRWAERTGLVASNPLRHLRKPPKASRGTKALVSASDHARLCKAAGPSFRSFLQLLWLTGARPGEIAGLTASDLDLAKGVAVLTSHKTAHLGKVRVIFLCGKAVGILRKLVKARPTGLLFPGQSGQRLSVNAVTCRFIRLCDKAGVKATAYGYRHTFATEALARGVPDAQVAALMGHSGTAMLHRHYSHLTAQSQALRQALGRVR